MAARLSGIGCISPGRIPPLRKVPPRIQGRCPGNGRPAHARTRHGCFSKLPREAAPTGWTTMPRVLPSPTMATKLKKLEDLKLLIYH